MAQSRESKEKDLNALKTLLESSKLTVAASYSGIGVKQLQELRKQAKEDGTTVRVVKNRLFKIAVEGNEQLSSSDTSSFTGQLIYAFNSGDEVAPAQSLQNFAKTNPGMELVAGISEDGTVMSADQVKALAELPSKEQLRAQLVGTIAAPLSGMVGVLAGNLRGLVQVLNAQSEQLEAK